MEGADFAGRRLRDPSVANSRLVRCDFRRTRITGGGLGDGREPSEYVECVFDGSSWNNVIPGQAVFLRCSFPDVKIRNLRCSDAQFIDCVFTGVLSVSWFNGRPVGPARAWRSRNEFRGNDFSGAKLVDVAFRTGIDLDLSACRKARTTSSSAMPSRCCPRYGNGSRTGRNKTCKPRP